MIESDFDRIREAFSKLDNLGNSYRAFFGNTTPRVGNFENSHLISPPTDGVIAFVLDPIKEPTTSPEQARSFVERIAKCLQDQNISCVITTDRKGNDIPMLEGSVKFTTDLMHRLETAHDAVIEELASTWISATFKGTQELVQRMAPGNVATIYVNAVRRAMDKAGIQSTP